MSGRALRPIVDVDAWCKRYDITLSERHTTCPLCGGSPCTYAPIAFGEIRGVEIQCPDNPNHAGAVLTPLPGSDEDKLWCAAFGKPSRKSPWRKK